MKAYLNKRTLILTVLFFFAFFIRFIFISKGPFHYDTLDLALTAQKTLKTFTLHYEHGAGYPLTVILGAFSIFIFKFFGVTDPVFCVNFMSVLAGAVGVLLLFFLVEKLFDDSTELTTNPELSRGVGFHKAVISAILLACFAPHVVISTFGKSLTLSICFSLSSAYYMCCYVQENKKVYLLLSALFLGFCAASRLSDVLVFLPISYLYFSTGKFHYERVRSFVAFCFIVSVTTAIYYLPMLFETGFFPFADVLTSSQQAEFLGVFSYVSKAALHWLRKTFLFNGILLIAFGFVFMVIKRQIRQFLFLVIWFLVLQLFYGNVSSSGPRYLVIAWIPLVIAQGSFLGSFKGKGFYLALFVVLAIALFAFLRFEPVLEFRHRRALQVEFAEWVSHKTSADSVIIGLDESIFLEYYAKRQVLHRPITCDRNTVEEFFDEVLDKLLEKGRKVYIVSSAMIAYDSCGVFRKRLFERYDKVFIGQKRNEDWHHALLNQVLFTEQLYQIKKKGLLGG